MFNKLEKDLRPVFPEEYNLVIDYFKGLQKKCQVVESLEAKNQSLFGFNTTDSLHFEKKPVGKAKVPNGFVTARETQSNKYFSMFGAKK